MDSVHWSSLNSNFNSAFHVGTSINTPFNFSRTLLKNNNSFNELATVGISFDSSAPAKSLDSNVFSTLSSAVIAASSTFIPASTTISPFFHSIPALSRSISSEFNSTPATVETFELESPQSESRSLCLSPDEQEHQEAERDHGTQDTNELDLSPAEHSPRSEAESDEWSVPVTNNESDINQSRMPLLKNSSLLDLAAVTHATSAVKKEEFSDSENENENEDEQVEDAEEEEEESETVKEEEKVECVDESEVEEEQVKAPRRSKPKPKSKQQSHTLQRTSRRGSSCSGRRAPISSAARLASQKKYDEKRRGIYRRLYTDLKEAIHVAQEVTALKQEDKNEQMSEVKKGKKKKKKKQKEIEDLSTRELLLLATSTIQQLQKQKSELDRDLLNAGVDDDEEKNMKEEKVFDKKRKRNSKSDKAMKSLKRAHTANSESHHSPIKRSWTETSPAFNSHALPLPLMPALSISEMVTPSVLSHQPALNSSPIALPLWSEFSNTAGTLKVEPQSTASASASSALLLLNSSNISSVSPTDELKRRAILSFIFLRLRSLFLSSSSLLSLLQTSSTSNVWCNTLTSFLHSNWSDVEIAAMTFEKIFVKAAEVVAALQWLLQEIEEHSRKMDGKKMEDWQLKEQWTTVAIVKKEMEALCSNGAAE